MVSHFRGLFTHPNPILTMDSSDETASPPSVPPITRRERLKESLENGELLVAFAARNALKPRDLEDTQLDDLVVNIADGRKAFDSDSLDSAGEAKLLNNLRRLAIAFLPVTAGSIRDSSCDLRDVSCGGVGAGRRYFFWGVQISHAEAAVRMFAIVSVIALLMLLAAQIVWLAGYELVNQWRALEKEDEVAEAALRSAGTTPKPSPTPPPASSEAVPASTPSAASDDRENRRIQKEALMNLILRWWGRFGVNLDDKPVLGASPSPAPSATIAASDLAPNPATPAASATPVEDSPPPDLEPTGLSPSDEDYDADLKRKIGTLVAVEAEVNIIQTYVLPLLYGLLGSCAYVLRQLTLEIRARTFRRELGISYWLHIFLGVLAGLAIGWFLRPEVGDNGLIRGLTPFALSFLAGYSVEVLFAAMDRLVAAFGPSAEKS